MVVIALENAPNRLRGVLSRWCLEVRAGLFVGRLDGRLRDLLWEKITDLMEEDGSAVMCWSKNGAQGYAFHTLGQNARSAVERDGIWLVVEESKKRSTP
jgi:CRISPR-associated protein Cas2